MPIRDIAERPEARSRRTSAAADVMLAVNSGFVVWTVVSRPLSTIELLFLVSTVVCAILLLLRATTRR